ncbi:mechanosensitive ion channel family protein [Geomonas sp.]|uniref:mechanosensitive ion channel family protein n=1 Tax=Geomonas sp. TaxID=2651584 RepID=UPI002B4607CC|nr:mechanosensitive ion channel domain-containing protein [Geomonas sp.]HJV35922.1 mechanosensitive ion channel domain-containing protein [Geomonas sp.]
MASLRSWLADLKDIFTWPLFSVGKGQEVTVLTLVYLIIFSVLLFYLSAKLRRWTEEKLLTRTRLDLGARQAVGAILRYLIVIIGFLVILQTAGIDLTTLNVLAGAVGIGAGFGLQNIVSNFISGLIIMFERPIKVGDRIVVGEIEGDVISIGARSVEVVSNDNITIIVPNAKFITENVINWSHNERRVRFRIPVTVAYDSDVHLVERLLLEAAAKDENVLDKPEPSVRLMEFGGNGLRFELRAWSTTLIQRKGLLVSSLNFAILELFRSHGIAPPMTQQELFIKRGSQKIDQEQGKAEED